MTVYLQRCKIKFGRINVLWRGTGGTHPQRLIDRAFYPSLNCLLPLIFLWTMSGENLEQRLQPPDGAACCTTMSLDGTFLGMDQSEFRIGNIFVIFWTRSCYTFDCFDPDFGLQGTIKFLSDGSPVSLYDSLWSLLCLAPPTWHN